MSFEEWFVLGRLRTCTRSTWSSGHSLHRRDPDDGLPYGILGLDAMAAGVVPRCLRNRTWATTRAAVIRLFVRGDIDVHVSGIGWERGIVGTKKTRADRTTLEWRWMPISWVRLTGRGLRVADGMLAAVEF